jgi:glycosyltransferase involved in cell wall biosynthesis
MTAEPSNDTGAILRIGLVVPRFGNVVGGAELLARWMAEQLAAAGHRVEVFTTCALSHTTWENAVPAGTEMHGPLAVHRFPTDPRDIDIFGELERAISSGVRLTRDEETLWLRNGACSQAMEDALARRAHEFDTFLGIPYLFGTTYFAAQTIPDRMVLIPCLHDEPYARGHFVREMLAGVRGIMFNSAPEALLGKELCPDLAPSAIVGVGIDERGGPVEVEGFRRRHRLAERLLLYVGRLEEAKNVPELIEFFLRYEARRQAGLQLVLAGSADMPIPRDRAIRRITVDWDGERDALYRAATVVCQPSRKESLSIVLMQGWLAERPAVVHGRSAVTRYQCERSNGGLWYTTYAEFEQVLDRLLVDASLRSALGRNGRAYVLREYSWPVVLERFDRAIETFGIAAGARTPAR